MRNAFVTGATGLLGNNLVRELVARGYAVKALVRSRDKGEQQFNDLPSVELVVGDLADIDAFATSLQGSDTVFHTAAFFRDNYKGGSHWEELEKINVAGTRDLLHQGPTARGYVGLSIPLRLPCSTATQAPLSMRHACGPKPMRMTITAARSSPTVSS